ncbi:MAG: TetR/AcrR family transcriptional regulator [Candidatus Omnitrophota bacterium]
MSNLQPRGQKTQSKIIQTAFELFHKQGVNATGVEEILAKSGTGKSQFYHYFKNKEDLIAAVIKDFCEKFCNRQLPVKYDINSWKDLEKWFTFFIQYQDHICCERGCPMATIGYELTADDEVIRQEINRIFNLSIQPVAEFFTRLKSQGRLKPTADPQALAELCFVTMQGGMLVSKIQKDTSSFKNSVKHILLFLKSFQQPR